MRNKQSAALIHEKFLLHTNHTLSQDTSHRVPALIIRLFWLCSDMKPPRPSAPLSHTLPIFRTGKYLRGIQLLDLGWNSLHHWQVGSPWKGFRSGCLPSPCPLSIHASRPHICYPTKLLWLIIYLYCSSRRYSYVVNFSVLG